MQSYIGQRDAYGYDLRVTELAVADEIAGAAELVMGKTEGIPVAVVRGLAAHLVPARAASCPAPRRRTCSAEGGAAAPVRPHISEDSSEHRRAMS